MSNGRLIVVALLLIILFNVLIGCKDAAADQPDATAPLEPTETVEPDDTFVVVDSTSYWAVMYHRDTHVMYVAPRGLSCFYAFTVMVDADGKPLLWDGNDNA